MYYPTLISCSSLRLFVDTVSGAMHQTVDDTRSGRELWRTSLCRHGPDHGQRQPDCRFAHSLFDLRRPDESRVSYATQWSHHTMDRFYGQRMSPQQLERIRTYYRLTRTCDLPLWSIGLRLLDADQESTIGFAYPWDFGLVRDYDDLLEARLVRSCPFMTWPGLWDRLARRRAILLTYQHPPHQLGLISPSQSMSGQEDTDGVREAARHQLADDGAIDRGGDEQAIPIPLRLVGDLGAVDIAARRESLSRPGTAAAERLLQDR